MNHDLLNYIKVKRGVKCHTNRESPCSYMCRRRRSILPTSIFCPHQDSVHINISSTFCPCPHQIFAQPYQVPTFCPHPHQHWQNVVKIMIKCGQNVDIVNILSTVCPCPHQHQHFAQPPQVNQHLKHLPQLY